MKTNWDLTVFYKDFDDPAFKADLGGLDASIAALTEAVAAPCEDEAAKLTALVGQVEALGMTFERLMLMVELTLSVDAQNKPANAAMAPLMRSAMLMEQANNALGRYLSKLENLSELVHSNETLSARAFALLEMAENAKHQLPEALEKPVMKMQLSGGQAFSQLRDKLDATLTVDYDGKAIPLSAARAMAYDADADVRRKAYDAELASYKKIEIPMSYCLNNIKAEGETMAKLRGYKGVLDMALAHFRMDEKTLDAMWTAIREALPELREYFKAKGRLLGHENGLPFYDLFAPVGHASRTYTVEEARALLLDLFGRFCPEMGDMMRAAFDEGWIDMYPREGKSGGAFCAGYYEKNISRVMTNFAGSASDVSTLAHELGHAFNNRMLRHKPLMMNDTPMPLAETASTFNETLLIAQLLKDATPEEELTLLDSCLVEQTQTMVDIYSRFLFEQKVVAAQADHALDVDELIEGNHALGAGSELRRRPRSGFPPSVHVGMQEPLLLPERAFLQLPVCLRRPVRARPVCALRAGGRGVCAGLLRPALPLRQRHHRQRHRERRHRRDHAGFLAQRRGERSGSGSPLRRAGQSGNRREVSVCFSY